MNRFDIPSIVTEMIEKAIEIDLIDASNVLAFGDTFGDDWAGIVNEIIQYAYSNIHVNDDHDIMCPYADNFYIWNSQKNRMTKTDEVEIPEDDRDVFDKRFEIFFNGAVQINHEYSAKSFPNIPPAKFSFKNNKRYMKIIRDGSVHCFVDKETGDVLKAASWSAPAKHARGNIFNDDNGLSGMGEYGPYYLK